jgi:hypothetical protein
MQWPISHYGDTIETTSLLPPHHAKQILYLAHTQHHASAQTISLTCMDFKHLGMFLIIHHKHMHFTIHFNPGTS